MDETQKPGEQQTAKDLRPPAELVAKMSDDELRVKVAELCGWTELERQFKDRPPEHSPLLGVMPVPSIFGGKARIYVPNYPADLNAMHEAEKLITDEQRLRFRLRLMFNSDGPKAVFQTVEAALCHATARQRAEALYETLSQSPDVAIKMGNRVQREAQQSGSLSGAEEIAREKLQELRDYLAKAPDGGQVRTIALIAIDEIMALRGGTAIAREEEL